MNDQEKRDAYFAFFFTDGNRHHWRTLRPYSENRAAFFREWASRPRFTPEEIEELIPYIVGGPIRHEYCPYDGEDHHIQDCPAKEIDPEGWYANMTGDQINFEQELTRLYIADSEAVDLTPEQVSKLIARDEAYFTTELETPGESQLWLRPDCELNL